MSKLVDKNQYSVEPIYDLAPAISAFELFSPKVDETIWFFKELLGMIETMRSGDSVYLRGWEDPYAHSLKVTYREQPGWGAAIWRATSPAALARRVSSLESSGRGRGWVRGEGGIGDAYEFTLPDGATHRIHWDISYYDVSREEKSVLLNRVQRRPLRGVPVRGLDHVNLMSGSVTDNRDFMIKHMGFKLSEQLIMPDGVEAGAWLRTMTRSHDLAMVKDMAGNGGRLHHVAFLYGNVQHLADICDVLSDHGLKLEAGPAVHAVSQANFAYVLEPGGNRIEVVGQAGYMIHDPSWEPVVWKPENVDDAIIYYGGPLPSEFETYATPVVGKTSYRVPSDYVATEARFILANA